MVNAISTALSGLTASTKKVETSAANIANVSTTGALDAKDGPAPYSAQTTIQSARDGGGVSASATPKKPGFVPAYDPNSPFANKDGEIGAPNVSMAEEAVTMKQAEMSYKANLNVIKTADDMMDEFLSTFDDKT